jgi:hypothetical protein
MYSIYNEVVILLGGIYDFQVTNRKQGGSLLYHTAPVMGGTRFSL